MLFAYCLLLTLLHSLWQAGAQALLYATATKTILQKTCAAAKRNLLLLQVGIQIVLSTITFLLYYTQPSGQVASALQSYADMGSALKPYLFAAAPWLVSLYFVWLGIKMTNLVMAWRQFGTLYKTGLQKPDIDLKLFTKVTAHHMGIKKNVQVWLSNNVHTPITFGHFKPIILLPVALVNQISMQQAEALIVHELTHIKVHDYLLNWLLAIAETIFFFNPFVNYLCNQAKLEREKYCDTNVLHFGKHPVAYAETLLLAAKLQQENIRWQLAAVGNKKQLLRRIVFFTSDAPLHTKKSKLGMALVPLLLVAGIFMAALVMSVSNNHQKQAAFASIAPISILLPNGNTTNNMASVVSTAAQENAIVVDAMAKASVPVITAPPVMPKKQPTVVADNIIGPSLETSEFPADIAITNVNGSVQNVSFTSAPLTREVIIEEENPSTGAKTLQIYVLTLKNGNWELTPKWMATSRIVAVDTGMLKLDTLQIRFTKAQ